jgi:hypothetical protein
MSELIQISTYICRVVVAPIVGRSTDHTISPPDQHERGSGKDHDDEPRVRPMALGLSEGDKREDIAEQCGSKEEGLTSRAEVHASLCTRNLSEVRGVRFGDFGGKLRACLISLESQSKFRLTANDDKNIARNDS